MALRIQRRCQLTDRVFVANGLWPEADGTAVFGRKFKPLPEKKRNKSGRIPDGRRGLQDDGPCEKKTAIQQSPVPLRIHESTFRTSEAELINLPVASETKLKLSFSAAKFRQVAGICELMSGACSFDSGRVPAACLKSGRRTSSDTSNFSTAAGLCAH